MGFGLYLNNVSGKRVIGSDTVAPRFIGKYNQSALNITSNYGDFLKYSVTCPGKPIAYLYIPFGYAASVHSIIKTAADNYDIYVYIPAYSAGLNYSDIDLYLFSDGNTIESTGYGLRLKKRDGEIAYDSGFSHAVAKGYTGQVRNLWIWVGANQAQNYAVGDTVYNLTRDEYGVVANMPYANIIEVYSPAASGDFSTWLAGDTLAKAAGDPTLATIGANAVVASQSWVQFLPINDTWSNLGIAKPAVFSYMQGCGLITYQYNTSLPNIKFWHYYARESFALATDGIVWGMMLARNRGGTAAQADANAAMVIGNYGFATHAVNDTCVFNQGEQVAALAADYYNTVSGVTWSLIGGDFISTIIDGADYD